MEHFVDLDVLAGRLRSQLDEWNGSAEVGPLLWRDETASWPQPLSSDRASIETPESLGITLRRGSADELEMVVWTGGWADIGCLRDGDAYSVHLEFHDVAGAYSALVETAEDFLA